jgi:HlyD family secretion protein
MKRLLPLAVVLSVLLAFAGTLGFLWDQSQPEPEPRRTVTVERRDVVLKTVATGAIEPRVEVAIKPAVSGVVSALHVEPGQHVEVGELIAELRIIPDSERLASAQSSIEMARIRVQDAQRELDQARKLQGQGAASRTELELAETTFELRQQELKAARSELQIVKTGATAGSRERSTEVRAHVAGMVLTVPVEVGYSVIETNSFNEGTTIASVADMGDLVFEGTLDESEVGKVSEGMPLDITVGAFPDERFEGSLEYISPKGEELNGAVVFAIRAALTPRDDNCPSDSNADQTDADGDGLGDACDACPNDFDNDADSDGVCGDVDNCPANSNSDQSDLDSDGEGDVCDDCTDADGDGVCIEDDICSGTSLPDVPSVSLGVNRWADTDGDGVFDTVSKGKGKGPGRSYTLEDTQGCSCADIIAACGVGDGHDKYGCSISVMDDWTDGDTDGDGDYCDTH